MSITESEIKNLANHKSYQRGQEYFRNNAILDLTKRGTKLIAEVEGSNYEAYQVNIELSNDSIISTYCTCPYDGSGVCKHIVAVLLKYLHSAESIDKLPTAQEVVANLGESDLRTILIELLESEPHLIAQVEIKATTLLALATQKQSNIDLTAKPNNQLSFQSQEQHHLKSNQPHTLTVKQLNPIDITPFKREAKSIFKSSNRRSSYDDDYYDDEYDSGIADEFTELFKKAKPFIELGDTQNAISILGAVMDVFVDLWLDEEYYDDISSMIEAVTSLFTEAILLSEFSLKEKEDLKEKLTEWQENLSNQGASDDFDLPIAAIEQGWDYPPLKAVLEGKTTETGAWETDGDGKYPKYAYKLNIIRLTILERQERNQEYLYFADAEGLIEQYATMLIKLNRSNEAIEYVLKNGLYFADAVRFATVLHDKGLIDDSLKIAEYCMQISEDYIDKQEQQYGFYNKILFLSRWLRDNAQNHSNVELALKGAKTAFKYFLSLEDYLAIEAIAKAKGEWERIKSELLTGLSENKSSKKYGFDHNIVKIYLHEKMLKQAIDVIDKSGSLWSYSNIEPVVDAVYKEFPDWAIKQCKHQAEPNMDNGKSNHYQHSVRWVGKVGKIYIEANRQEEWKEYLEGLIKKHRQKYSLRPQLEALRKLYK